LATVDKKLGLVFMYSAYMLYKNDLMDDDAGWA
jgi:hypothetical protein